ncbi:DNA translocase FtsK [Endobacterium cereale]|uniref:DNA translocase FtsK n=1 Tax=Endobacterium cereale TaxID=2663029 RepID=UPI00397B930D
MQFSRKNPSQNNEKDIAEDGGSQAVETAQAASLAEREAAYAAAQARKDLLARMQAPVQLSAQARKAAAAAAAAGADLPPQVKEDGVWQQAFTLAPNVRFTRTPESTLSSRHADAHEPEAAVMPDAYAQLSIEGAGEHAARKVASAPSVNDEVERVAAEAAAARAAAAEAFRNSLPKTGSPLIVPRRMPVAPAVAMALVPMTPVSGPVSQIPAEQQVPAQVQAQADVQQMVATTATVAVPSILMPDGFDGYVAVAPQAPASHPKFSASGSVDTIAGLQQLAAAMRRGLVQNIPAPAGSLVANDVAPVAAAAVAASVQADAAMEQVAAPVAVSDFAFWEVMPFDIAEIPPMSAALDGHQIATPVEKPAAAAPLPVIVQTPRAPKPAMAPEMLTLLHSRRRYAPAGSVVALYREVATAKHAEAAVELPSLPPLLQAAIEGPVSHAVQPTVQAAPSPVTSLPEPANQQAVATMPMVANAHPMMRAGAMQAAAMLQPMVSAVAVPVGTGLTQTTAFVQQMPVAAERVAAPAAMPFVAAHAFGGASFGGPSFGSPVFGGSSFGAPAYATPTVPAVEAASVEAVAEVAVVEAPVEAAAAPVSVPVPVPTPTPSNVTITVPPATPARAQTVRPSLAEYEFPPIGLLQEPRGERGQAMQPDALQQSAGLLESILEDFGVKGEIIDVRPGPVVTLYEFEPAPGVKSSRVIGLADDIARSMSALSARVAVVPGRNVIGIELPNAVRETVFFRELIECEDYWETKHRLALCLGKTIGGEPVIAELAKMPHLLVAGTTGSGKSVAINTMILSLLYRLRPEECRLIMIDPKMLELSVYDGIPHLLTPVVTDPKKAVLALKWAVREMEDRYRKMSRLAVRNIDGYNQRAAAAREAGEVITVNVQVGFDRHNGEIVYEEQEMDLAPMPYIVVIIDEMADLMMVAGKEIEGAVQRLAQMARAAGIHVIMATQRPSVDVITGTIKANFPTRISFQVTSKIDSRTILGEQGAENLLGQGDMLHMAGGGRISRVHGPFVSDAEVEHVVKHLKMQGRPEYLGTVTEDEEDGGAEETTDESVFDKSAMGSEDSGDDLYDKAVKVVLKDKKCSTSYIQRRLSVGYNRAASLVERMEQEGLVGPANHVGKREIIGDGRGPQGSGMDD